MILILFGVFVIFSLIFIALGLFFSEHTELSLIGFVFLFLLSFTVINNNLQYQTGQTKEINYTYNADTSLNATHEVVNNTYISFNDTTSKFNTHIFGYWLALASFIGFVGIILGLRKSRRYE